LELSSAYDTVWKRGLTLKLAKIIRCKSTLHLIESLLSNRKYNVFLNGTVSRYRYLQNGLPQGSVLSPILFNVYTLDIVDTTSRKFIYADDIALVAQAKDLSKAEDILNQDLTNLQHYFAKWHLTLNPNKTVAIALHLNNREAQKELKLKIGDNHIVNEECPKYLGMRIDRSLTFKKHLEDVKNKLKSRNNIISKLAGANWGSNTKVLQISAIALGYSVVEYCAPVWARSAHCHEVDTELNRTM